MKNAIHPHTKSVIIVIYLLILITLPYLYIWYVNKTDCVYYPRKQSLRGIRTLLSNKKTGQQTPTGPQQVKQLTLHHISKSIQNFRIVAVELFIRRRHYRKCFCKWDDMFVIQSVRVTR